MRLMEGDHVGPFNLGKPGEFTMPELAKVVQETIDPNASSVKTPKMTLTSASPTSPVPRSSLAGSQRPPFVRAFPSWSLTSASASWATKTVRPPRPEASKDRNEHKRA
jgi:hypothetical protein